MKWPKIIRLVLGYGIDCRSGCEKYNVSREDQDIFLLNSHDKALAAIKEGKFKEDIVPITVKQVYLDENEKRKEKEFCVRKTKVHAQVALWSIGKIEAGVQNWWKCNCRKLSQTSDGAAFVLIVSESQTERTGVEPIARMVSYGVSGMEPSLMGVGPI
jgi:acetyl-CoA acyltransferase